MLTTKYLQLLVEAPNKAGRSNDRFYAMTSTCITGKMEEVVRNWAFFDSI
jgi:hypothetical protein